AAGSVQALYKAVLDRVAAVHKEDRYRGCYGLRRSGSHGICHDQRGLSPNQIGEYAWQPVTAALSGAILDDEVARFVKAGFVQALPKSRQEVGYIAQRRAAHKPDHGQCGRLRTRHGRTHSRAAEQRDELAPPDHSITSSARASSVSGTVRPSALAVLMLITSSNLVGACTGRSAGFSPLSMRSTYEAERRKIS